MKVPGLLGKFLHGSAAIARHEQVVFFPTVAQWREETPGSPGGSWHVPVHGWIFRPAELSRLRQLDLWLLRRALRGQAALDEVAQKFLKTRAGAFLADNERWRRLSIQVGEAIVKLGRSRANGHFRGELQLPQPEPSAADTGHCAQGAARWIQFRALVPADDPRHFPGRAMLLPAQGISVISDIDDTVKLTEVTQRKKMLANTFLREFAAVPGMAALYRRWEQELGAAFHYVSGSPWHLYPFLEEFLGNAGFPAGTFHLRQFRLMPREIRQSVRPARRVKLKHARELFTRFPGRRFILVGDSGESDAAMYARLHREFPRQVERICIRDIGGEGRKKCEKALQAVPSTRWQLFCDPAELH